MADTLQFAVIQKDVFTHLKQGKDALEEINRQMRIEDIDKLTSENADAIAYQEEVSQMLGAKLTEQYEDEVEKEFAELEAEVIAESTRKLPSVPEHPIPKVDSELVQQDVGEAGQDREMPARALARSQAEEEEEEAEEEERQRVPMLA
ncbi:Vacuolar protein sorting-associated protein 20 [Spiromyces aspiralis]|uniref:Vacuolar protein sorting-associated protein 20 n=1 Tax=Spiromyces aspiralis TaxID=68401 RepID=A0ACC1HX89_9FUNG|nr:Vacuolar protein sorting-associated protein 20 [Spiromyces aspiralis]